MYVLDIAKKAFDFLLLLASLRHHARPHERRVAHDVVGARPVHPQRVALNDAFIVVERQKLRHYSKYLSRLLKHLRLAYPHGRLGDSHCEVVDLDSVELLYGNLYDAVEIEQPFAGLQPFADLNRLVLEPAEREERLGEEVAGAAGRIKKRQRAELFLKGQRPGAAIGYRSLSLDGSKLHRQFPEKQRVDDLVDVLD